MVASSYISGLNSTQRTCKFAFPQTRSNELSMQSMHYSHHSQSHTQCSKPHSVSYLTAAKLFPLVDLFFAISSLKSVATVTHIYFDSGSLVIHEMISDGGCNFSFWSSISMIQLSR